MDHSFGIAATSWHSINLERSEIPLCGESINLHRTNAKDIYEQGITHLNIGTGEDLSIAELADLIKKIIGFEGEIVYDTTKPDGTSRKLLDVSRIHALGWKHKTSLEKGIKKTYNWYLENEHKFKR